MRVLRHVTGRIVAVETTKFDCTVIIDQLGKPPQKVSARQILFSLDYLQGSNLIVLGYLQFSEPSVAESPSVNHLYMEIGITLTWTSFLS